MRLRSSYVDWELYQWQEFFAIEELEEMNEPEFMDEVEAIVKSKRQLA